MGHLARFAVVLLPFALTAFVACGGEVTSATGGNAGHGGKGTGGASAGCPTSEPGFGSACAEAGLSCSYGNTCCPSTYECDGSTWQALPTGCDPPVSCPADVPAPGATCDVCFEPGPCVFICPGTAVQVTATCGGGAWTIDGDCPAPPPVDCGGKACAPNEVCVQSAGGVGYTYACAPDPCAPAALSCDCAKALCGGPSFQCDGAMGQTLMCSCPTCA